MGYDRVEIITRDDYFNTSIALDYIRENGVNSNKCPTKSAINLEVWVPTFQSKEEFLQHKRVYTELGAIAPPGRFGWFIPKQPQDEDVDSLHWKVFQRREFAAKYDVTPKIETSLKKKLYH